MLDELSYDIVNDIYEVNGEVVDKEVYDNKISEYSLVNAASDYLTYDGMKKYLLDSIESENRSETDEQITTEQTVAATDIIKDISSTESTVTYNTKRVSSPKTGNSEPVFCELIIIGFISASTIMLLRKKYKSKYAKRFYFVFYKFIKLILPDCVRSTILLSITMIAVASVVNILFSIPFSPTGGKSRTAIGTFYQPRISVKLPAVLRARIDLRTLPQ